MALTPNKNYNNQLTGSNVNTWGVVLNQNYTITDLNLGGRLNLSVAGSADITVTSNQAQNLMHILSGVLTGDIDYILPALGGVYAIQNDTTGAFDLMVRIAGGGAGIKVPQGSSAIIFANPDVPEVFGNLFDTANLFTGGTTTGAGNAQVLATVSPFSEAFTTGQMVTAVAGYTNTGTMTFNVGGEGAVAVRKNSSSGLAALVGGEIVAGNVVIFVKDLSGPYWVIGSEFPLGSMAYLNVSTVIGDNGSGLATILPGTVTNAMQANLPSGQIKSNIIGSPAPPADNTLTAILDAILGSTRGMMITRGASQWGVISPGVAKQGLQTGGSGADIAWGETLGSNNMIIVQNAFSNGTSGGTFTSGAWRTRALNTVPTNNITGSTVTGNQVTLPIGTYVVDWSAAAWNVNRHQTRWRDVTNNLTIGVGKNMRADSNGSGNNDSVGWTRFSILAPTTFELQHICETTGTFGQDNTISGNSEIAVYAYANIYKTA